MQSSLRCTVSVSIRLRSELLRISRVFLCFVISGDNSRETVRFPIGNSVLRPRYLQDAANVVDVATLMALSVSQRKVLCELLGAAPSADAQTAAAHIVCMYGSPLNQQPPPPPPLPPPSQWRDLMAAAHNVPLPASDAMTASAAEIVAKLACTPFVAAPAGLGLPQLQEVGYCTLWAHEYLTGQGAWDSLTATAQAELCAHLGISAAMAPEWAQKSFYCNLRFLEG